MTNTPNAPLEVHVQVFLHPGAPNGDFHFETSDLPMGPDNHLYFTNQCHPGFLIHYDLQGNNAYVFPDSSISTDYLHEALYCHAHANCPTSKATWGQFTGQSVEQAGKTLVVLNKNDSPANFAYTLRVTNDRGSHYLPLDPGGTNRNGGVLKNSSSATLVAIGGAVVGVLLTLGAQALFGS